MSERSYCISSYGPQIARPDAGCSDKGSFYKNREFAACVYDKKDFTAGKALLGRQEGAIYSEKSVDLKTHLVDWRVPPVVAAASVIGP